MAENEQTQEPDFRAVAGLVLRVAEDRPDLLLVELKTLQGPVRFSMPKGVATTVANRILEAANTLAPDKSTN